MAFDNERCVRDITNWTVRELVNLKRYPGDKFDFAVKRVGDRVYLFDGRPEFRA